MCGYCTEPLGFAQIHYIQSGADAGSIPEMFEALWHLHLQDCPDIRPTLNSIPPEKAKGSNTALVIGCRGLEILIAKGFASAEYQALLNIPAFQAAIEAFTGQERRELYLADDPRFDLSPVRWVLDRQVFIEAGYLENRIARWSWSDAEFLLKQYVDFCLKGIGLKRNDLEKHFEETGVMDTIEDICEDDRKAFSDRLPAFGCSLHWMGKQAVADTPLLWEMAIQPPIGVPDFDALDLWLQHRAALVSYDRLGIKPFKENFASIRPELFRFLGLLRGISHEERSELLKVLDRPRDAYQEEESFDIRSWLETGNLQLDRYCTA